MPVLSEIATMTEAMQGTSIARFGHGELAIMNGEDARFQKYDPKLAEELRGILRSSPCLVCVPHAKGDRAWEWQTFLDQYGKCIDPNRWYGSSFVWWKMPVPRGMNWGPGEPDAYARVDEMEEALTINNNQPVLISYGPTGAVLADRLSRKGIWAIDIGKGSP